MAYDKIKKEKCAHLGDMKITTSALKKCELCDEMNSLRLCTFCGCVFCCQSHLGHDEDHFKETGHPIIIPLPASSPFTWVWCWIDNAYLE